MSLTPGGPVRRSRSSALNNLYVFRSGWGLDVCLRRQVVLGSPRVPCKFKFFGTRLRYGISQTLPGGERIFGEESFVTRDPENQKPL